MFLRKSVNLIKLLIRYEISRTKEFKADAFVNIITNIIYVIANISFWYFIFSIGYNIEGWSYGDVIIFIAFSELFFGLDNSAFSIVSRFWMLVVSGVLDVQLTRPLDPRARIMLLNLNYLGIIRSIITFVVILCISNTHIKLLSVLLGIIIVLLSSTVLSFIRLVLSYTSFWFGRMDGIAEITDCLAIFNKYPLVIMPKTIILLFKFVLPFFFFSTFSAEIVTNKLDTKGLLIGISILISNLVLWFWINKLVWKRGMARYESSHG